MIKIGAYPVTKPTETVCLTKILTKIFGKRHFFPIINGILISNTNIDFWIPTQKATGLTKDLLVIENGKIGVYNPIQAKPILVSSLYPQRLENS